MPTAERVSSHGRTSNGGTDCSAPDNDVVHAAQQDDAVSTPTEDGPSEGKRSYVNAETYFQSMLSGRDDKIELCQDLTGSNACGVGTITEGRDGEPKVPPSSKLDLRTGLPTFTAAFDFSPPKAADDRASNAQASGHESSTPSQPSHMIDEEDSDEGERGRARHR